MRRLPGGSSAFECADGQWVICLALTEGQFKRLCHISGLEHLAESEVHPEPKGLDGH